MKLGKAIVPFGCLAVLAVAGTAAAGIPNFANSTLGTAATVPVSMVLSPDGQGDPFTAARLYGGGTTDATITLTLRDINFDPVVGYPAEDVWLEAVGLCACVSGAIADGPSSSGGVLTFASPPFAGGCTEGADLYVVVAGDQFPTPITNIHFNSPERTCDLTVNLSDLTLYAQAPNGAYTADLYWDGQKNLSDLVIFASHSGATCP